MIRLGFLIFASLLLHSTNRLRAQSQTPAKAATQKKPAPPKPTAAKPAPPKPTAAKPAPPKAPAAKPAPPKAPAAKPALQKATTAKAPPKLKPNSKPKSLGQARGRKQVSQNQNNKNITASEDELLNDLLRDRAGKRKSSQDKKIDEYLVLTAKALVELKKKYRSIPIEYNFDDRIDRIIQQYFREGTVMSSKTKDSIVRIYAINYIQSFDLHKKNELSALSNQLFTTINLASGKHSNPRVIERLNKVPQDDNEQKLNIVIEELASIIFETWQLEIITLLNKYQILVK